MLFPIGIQPIKKNSCYKSIGEGSNKDIPIGKKRADGYDVLIGEKGNEKEEKGEEYDLCPTEGKQADRK